MSEDVEIHYRGRRTADGLVVEWYVLGDDGGPDVVVREDRVPLAEVPNVERISARLATTADAPTRTGR